MPWPLAAVFIAIVLWFLSIIICFLLYKHVILILYGPLAGYLSEKTEQAVGGEVPPSFSLRLLFEDVIRGIVLNIITLSLSLFFMLLAWLLVFIPLAGAILSPVILFLVQAFFTGVGLVDFTLERKRFRVSSSLQFTWAYRGRVSGVGAGFLMLMFIPLIGWFLAPGYGVIAGTLGSLDLINMESKSKNLL